MNSTAPCISVLTIEDGASPFAKIAEVEVEFAEKNGVIQTLEGDVPYKARDAILTGIKGERWPIERSKFDEWYCPVEGSQGRYRKSKSVLAKQMTIPFRVLLADGRTF